MGGCFAVIRWIVSLVLLTGIVLTVLVGVPLSVLANALTCPEQLTKWIEQSGLYTSAPEIANEIANRTVTDGSSSFRDTDHQTFVNFNTQIEEQDFRSILTPLFVQRSAETIITASYRWFSGVTDRPDFAISFADTPEIQLLQDRTQFSSDMLPVAPETTRSVQTVYTVLELFPIITVSLLVILLLVIITICPRLSAAMICSGLSIFLPSVILAIPTVYLHKTQEKLHTLISAHIAGNSPTLAGTISTLADIISNDLVTLIRWISAAGAVLGLALLISGIIIGLKHHRTISQTLDLGVQPE
ncbi:MAG: hypothetical protein PHG63_01935 [Candidatus Dojkabacteria bacterium]|nr:hypothetical protein [Candidatus Dojkabacteria bacterium]